MSDEVYSPGLEGVLAGETAISTLAGGLSYRGYSIEDLGSQSTFEETAYLILYGDLPNREELQAFCCRLQAAANLPHEVVSTLSRLPHSTPMMDVMRTGASLLAHWDPDVSDNSSAANLRKAERLLAQLPLVMATAWRARQNRSPVPYDPKLSLAGNILWLLEERQPSSRATRAMDMTLIMYAEHEYNASTFAARVVCSTLSDLHSSITAAIGALKGPLHGGANERVIDVLDAVGAPERAEHWIRSALARKERIMGFGHRVYKTGDVRAKFLKPLCQELAQETGNEPLERTAEILEKIVMEEKKLPPNLDWPSARIYRYLGLPVDLYTPLFVLSRTSGWSAHVIEQLANNRLIRPRSRYIGPASKAYVALEQR